MAIELRFKCSRDEQDYLTVYSLNENVWIGGKVNGKSIGFCFDVTTAIKFSKTIRTEINKAKDDDFNNKSNLF